MSVQNLSTLLNVVYLIALTVGVGASAGLVYCNNRLQRESNVQIAQANESAALANKKTEELRQQNLKIRQQMADRILSGEARKTLIASIRYQGHVGEVTYIADREASDYADEIFSAFREASWAMGKRYRTPQDPDPRPEGIICQISDNPSPIVRAVVNALEKAGANPRTQPLHVSAEFINIVVGQKPKD